MDIKLICSLEMGVPIKDIFIMDVHLEVGITSVLFSYPSGQWGKAAIKEISIPDEYCPAIFECSYLH